MVGVILQVSAPFSSVQAALETSHPNPYQNSVSVASKPTIGPAKAQSVAPKIDPALLAIAQRNPAKAQLDLDRPAHPLDDVAARIAAQEHNSVEPELLAHIAGVEDADGRYAAELQRPLLLLGDVYLKQQRVDAAIEAYQRAVHIARIADGLSSSSQVDGLYKEAEALVQSGDLKSAHDREEQAYELLVKNFAETDLQLLPATVRMALWYERVNHVRSARHMYLRALKIYQAHDQDYSLEAIPVLKAISNSYKRAQFPSRYIKPKGPTGRETIHRRAGASYTRSLTGRPDLPLPNRHNFRQGERALRQVIGILQAQPTQDPKSLAEAITELGDWMLLFDNNDEAERLYRHAFDTLQAHGLDAVTTFAEPKLLHFPVPADPRLAPWREHGTPLDGTVTVRFRINDAGEVRGIKTQTASPGGLVDHSLRSALRMARFRPALNHQGEVVAFDSFDFTHRFKYHALPDS